MHHTSLLLLLLLLGTMPLSVCGGSGVGALFDLGASPRLQGMGGVGLALSCDAEAVHYNPAFLGDTRSWLVSSMYASHFGGVSFGTVGIGGPRCGVELFILDSGPIEGLERTLRYTTQGLIAAFGTHIVSDIVGAGVRLRYLRTTTPVKTSGWTVDPCLSLTVSGWRAGVMIEGAAGRGIQDLRGREEAWAREVSVGLGYERRIQNWFDFSGAVEIRDAFSSTPEIAGGLQFKADKGSVRIGFDGIGLTAGLSLSLNSVQLDLSYARQGELGSSSRVGITLDVYSLLRQQGEGRQ